MLFLLFQLGSERYAIRANCVAEVVPLLALKRLPQAPKGITGIFNYRGRPVPALDLSELTLGQPASERLSTRIIVIYYGEGTSHLLGLVAEQATEMLRRDATDFVEPGVMLGTAPYLGPVLMDGRGPIHLINEQHLVPAAMRDLLFAQPAPVLLHDER